MSRKITPFPVRFAEKVPPVPIDGEYNDALQRGSEQNSTGPLTTSTESATGGSNDTDQDYDQD